jgi:3'-phosphoadenosine 5'-phosphosulfate sulfotransferase (PAPS reductase)/FAD synthetase
MTRNPYLISGPAQISFSGGRSSGMMLCKIVEAHGGTLPDDVIVAFANTGKEREETLQFVDRVARHLGVAVRWIEFRPVAGPQKDRWEEVTFGTAGRNGEPFTAMTEMRGYPPNPVARICTQHLKIKPMEGLMRSLGLTGYVNVSGIRADEPRRIAKMRARPDVDFVLPLADAGVTKEDVVAYWKAMPFDLELPSVNGETIGGNCDLCYLKGVKKLLGLIREEPSRADWWIKQEAGGKLFRIDRPNYAALKVIAMQPQLFDAEEQESMPCECTD